MSKYIDINIDSIPKLATNRLKNIYSINKKWLYQTLGLNGYDTSNLANICWDTVHDDFYNNREFNRINYLDLLIKKELIKRQSNLNE